MKSIHNKVCDAFTTLQPKVLNGERSKVSAKTFNHVANPYRGYDNARNSIVTAIKDGAP